MTHPHDHRCDVGDLDRGEETVRCRGLRPGLDPRVPGLATPPGDDPGPSPPMNDRQARALAYPMARADLNPADLRALTSIHEAHDRVLATVVLAVDR